MNHKNPILLLTLTLASTQIYAGAMGSIEAPPDNCRSWYIRGDIGGNFYNNPQVSTAGSDNNAVISPNSSISNSMGYTGGVGYQFLHGLRADVTFTARPNINVSVLDSIPEFGRGTLRNYTVMANLYLDLDYFNMPIVPYFMGGVGSSWFNGYNNINWPVIQQNEFGQTTQRFAWQIGVGGTHKVVENLLIDLNYQFIALGTTNYTGHYDQNPVAPYPPGLYGAPTSFANIKDNQIQIGLRYYII